MLALVTYVANAKKKQRKFELIIFSNELEGISSSAFCTRSWPILSISRPI
jgi:hypothetical protein